MSTARRRNLFPFFMAIVFIILLGATLTKSPELRDILINTSVNSDRQPSHMATDEIYHLNETDVKSFLDEKIPEYMEEANVGGIIVSVVKDGAILCSSGYGYANIAENIPATENTLFGIASISKTFTATAVMTLVESGELDLNVDINTYLTSLQVPTLEGSDPITLAHLLSHTAGFEESIDPVFFTSLASMPSMSNYLANHMPGRVFPAGYIQSYSNLGASIAGLVVEDVSGLPYAQFLEENVLNPLGLYSTTALQDLPSSLAERYSLSYSGSDPYNVVPHTYCVVPPTGGISSTANDMAQFMLMNLNEGEHQGKQFLEPAIIQEMQSEQYIGHPNLTGVGYGFYMRIMNGQTMVYHTGGMPTFTSIMALFPEHEVGIFISLNTISGDYYDILDMFLDRYFPYSIPPLEDPSSTSEERLSMFEGYYLPTRREYIDLSDSLIQMNGEIITQVEATPDNTLFLTSNYLPNDGIRYIEVDNMLFRDASGQTDEYIGFRVDDDGMFMFLSDSPLTAMEKIDTWYLEINCPDQLEYIQGESTHEIYWTVNAAYWQQDVYVLYCDGVLVESGYWTTRKGITYDMSSFWPGTYNLTLLVKDVLGTEIHDSVVVEILPNYTHLISILLIISSSIILAISLIVIYHARIRL